MFENLSFGKIGFKTCVFEKILFLKNFAYHTHAFYSYFSMLGGVFAQNWLFFKNVCFFFFFFFLGISIDCGCFLINQNWF